MRAVAFQWICDTGGNICSLQNSPSTSSRDSIRSEPMKTTSRSCDIIPRLRMVTIGANPPSPGINFHQYHPGLVGFTFVHIFDCLLSSALAHEKCLGIPRSALPWVREHQFS